MDTIALGPFSAYAYGPTSIGMSCGGGEGEVSPLLNAQGHTSPTPRPWHLPQRGPHTDYPSNMLSEQEGSQHTTLETVYLLPRKGY